MKSAGINGEFNKLLPDDERRIEKFQKKAEEAEILLSLSNSIATIRNKLDLFDVIDQKLKKLFEFDDFVICLINDDRKTHSAFIYNQKEDFQKREGIAPAASRLYSLDDGMCRAMISSSEPVVFNIKEVLEWDDAPAWLSFWDNMGIKEMIGLKITYLTECIGFFYLYCKKTNSVSNIYYNLLHSISLQISVAVSNIKANEKIEQQLLEINAYKQQLEEEKIYLQEQVDIKYNHAEIIGQSQSLKGIFHLIEQVAPSDSTVLILGETGTGKELIARAIHNLSPRSKKLMVKINCAALPSSLAESELFGHEKGSFTGATERRIGKFELAHNGTLFLDEIGDLSIELQVKLLRVLQEKEIERIGGKGTIKTNVRILAATNRNLLKEIEKGNFRSDLYYRLNVFPITVPPLRERTEDIPNLVSHFINRFSKRTGRNVHAISKIALKKLMLYPWPGNIRELEHLMERSILLTKENVVKEIHLPKLNQAEQTDFSLEQRVKTIHENERDHILSVLKRCNGKISGTGGAAEILNIPPTTLNSKIKKFRIKKEHLLMLMLFLSSACFGQSSSDQAKPILDTANKYIDRKGTNKADVDTAISYLKRAQRLFHSDGNKEQEATTLKEIADLHLQTCQYDLAEKELLEALSIYKSIKYTKLWYTYDLLSAINNKKGNLSQALYYSLLAVRTCQYKNKEIPGIFSRRVSEAYESMGDKTESIAWNIKAFEYFTRVKDLVMVYLNLYELTTQLVNNNHAEKALRLILQTQKKFPNPSSLNAFYRDMAWGNYYVSIGRYKNAEHYYKPFIKGPHINQLDDEAKATAYLNIGKLYFLKKDYKSSAIFLEKLEKLNTPINIPVQISVNEMFFEIDKLEGRSNNAITRLQRYHKLKDSLFSLEKTNLIERLHIEFKSAQKENENELLRKKDQIQGQQLDKERLTKNIILAGTIGLSLFIILLYSRFLLKKRIHDILLSQKSNLDIAYQKLETSVKQKNRLIEDKEFLIKEVHHRVKNNLQLTMSLLNTQSHYLKDDSAIAAIRESQHRLKSIALIHQKLYQEENVSTINVRSYIIELVGYLKQSLGYQRNITFKLEIVDIEIDIAQAVPLGLCINEAITNVFKYAFPDHRTGNVMISFYAKNEHTYALNIYDNGIGLPPDFDLFQSNTLGMTLLKGLSQQLEGKLTFHSENGLNISLLFNKTYNLPETEILDDDL